jgi:hypothetical protein
MMRMTTFLKTTCATVAMLLIGTGARADLLYATPAGFGAASADFSLSGTTLTVTLTNTATGLTSDVPSSSVLTALAFNVPTTDTLTPVTAGAGGTALGNGSTLIGGSVPSGQVLGDNYGFGTGLSFLGFNAGIGAAGLNIFGQGSFGTNPQNVDGVDYGLLPSGDGGTGSGVSGHGPFAENAVVFSFTVKSGFKLSDMGPTVSFVYGTTSNVGDHHVTGVIVPEPSTMAIAGLGALVFVTYGLRRRMKS